MTCRCSKGKDKANVTSKNYAKSMNNQAHDKSPYGEDEPSVHTTFK